MESLLEIKPNTFSPTSSSFPSIDPGLTDDMHITNELLHKYNLNTLINKVNEKKRPRPASLSTVSTVSLSSPTTEKQVMVWTKNLSLAVVARTEFRKLYAVICLES